MDVNEAKKALEANKREREKVALEEFRAFIEEWGERHGVRLKVMLIPVDMGNGTYGMRPIQNVEAID
jgi:hypothetical protein